MERFVSFGPQIWLQIIQEVVDHHLRHLHEHDNRACQRSMPSTAEQFIAGTPSKPLPRMFSRLLKHYRDWTSCIQAYSTSTDASSPRHPAVVYEGSVEQLQKLQSHWSFQEQLVEVQLAPLKSQRTDVNEWPLLKTGDLVGSTR